MQSNNYHGMQLKAEKRFSDGYSLLGHYTWSRAFNYTNTYYNIDRDPGVWPERQSPQVTCSGSAAVCELPFGKGRRYLS